MIAQSSPQEILMNACFLPDWLEAHPECLNGQVKSSMDCRYRQYKTRDNQVLRAIRFVRGLVPRVKREAHIPVAHILYVVKAGGKRIWNNCRVYKLSFLEHNTSTLAWNASLALYAASRSHTIASVNSPSGYRLGCEVLHDGVIAPARSNAKGRAA